MSTPSPVAATPTATGAADEVQRARRAVEAIWRIESGRLVAGLARVTGDVGVAEDLAQEALVVALEQWPSHGVPPNPAGWLMTTAKRRAIDAHRRDATFARKV
ncbi:MAG TPA: sigma factor, partial [Intrasporangium sp.]|nr:sigma factor [Intrasporangium sp.]